MNEKVKILFFCMVFVAEPAFSQKNSNATEKNLLLSTIKKINRQTKSTAPFSALNITKSKMLFSENYKSLKPLPVITADYYSKSLAFFCKKEWAFEKVTSIPFKIRLGSVEQCDYLEGKYKRH